MKRFFIVLFLLLFVSSAFAEDVYVGTLAQLNTSEEEYKNFVLDMRGEVGFSFLNHEDEKFRYYDSITALQLALNAGEISEIHLPDVVGEYFVKSNPSYYAVSCVTQVKSTYLALGFLSKNTEYRDKINNALALMKEDGTLENLRVEYIENFDKTNLKPIEIAKFNGADTIKIALTGDLPPIDFVASNGEPAGFNMAIISEIGKHAKLNIEVIDIDAGARVSALASGRVGAVLWYKVTRDSELQPDIPAGIILSEPYYEWNKFLHIKKK
ncbi:MAG: transporter substrate-binding domain-containing protein [Synergistaceae bacterium]|nr:transporter substrate-binding domain-containing protein [Synergistaceae bacterium]